MQKVIRIGKKNVGDDCPVFIIAEAGVNHNGDVNIAKKLIEAAKESGADAVKFQTFRAENIVTKTTEKADYQKKMTGSNETQYEMLKKLELRKTDFMILSKYAKKRDIMFISTPYDEQSVDLLDKIGVSAFKVASAEIINFVLLKSIAAKEKPVILSTGMSTLGEIEECLNILKNEGADRIILLHCITNYPAKIEDMNLLTMNTLKQAFKLPTGLSDHTFGYTIPIASVALGACVIEKHFTLNRNLPGPDHKASLEPYEFKEMVKAVRDVQKALGDGVKKPTRDEEKIKRHMRRCIVAQYDIAKGVIITEDMLVTKRAGVGIEPKYIPNIIGCKAIKDIRRDEALAWRKIGRV